MLESESVGSSICGTDDTQQNNNVIKNAEKENNSLKKAQNFAYKLHTDIPRFTLLMGDTKKKAAEAKPV